MIAWLQGEVGLLLHNRDSLGYLLVLTSERIESVSEEKPEFLNQELNLGSLAENQESKSLVHQKLGARSAVLPTLTPIEKCIPKRG